MAQNKLFLISVLCSPLCVAFHSQVCPSIQAPLPHIIASKIQSRERAEGYFTFLIRSFNVQKVLILMKSTVVMYGCESWTVKKAERRRIDAFELWCWRRLLRVPWTARRSNQSILNEISPGISLEGMMLKLKLQYFGHLMQRVEEDYIL